MARRKSFLNEISKAARAMEREQKARQRREQQAQREYERAQNAYQRAEAQALKQAEQERKAQEKEKKRLYTESRIAEAASKNEQLEETISQLGSILHDTLSIDDFLDLETLKRKLILPAFGAQKPIVDTYLPPKPSFSQRLIPGTNKKFNQALEQAKARYNADVEKYKKAKLVHKSKVDSIRKEVEEQHAEIDSFKRDFAQSDPEAIINYFTLVLESSVYPDDFPQHAKVAFVPESKQLVIEYDLPSMDVVPENKSYKYVKTRDEITSTAQPVTKRKSLYASIIAQVAIRTLHEIFEADRTQHLETIVFNGYVDSIDLSTGRSIRPCLVTVRTTRDTFDALDLERVDPALCLKGLNASVSKKPDELAPVRPVVEFNMIDSRFVEETDVLSELDQRQNLMELSPFEFENLITNLFQSMGLETRQTQSSRDGGVDCVAFDNRPIFGGKVVIQAKRYKNTVGVSSVRDLFGTVQNEGASKGILVTTSGYGKASYEFAEGKPLELLSGSNLLHLLQEHAGIEAKIEPPEDWSDPIPDSESA